MSTEKAVTVAAERIALEEAARQAQDMAATEASARIAQEEAKRQAQEKAATEAAERTAAVEAARRAQEKAATVAAERKAAEEAERQAQETNKTAILAALAVTPVGRTIDEGEFIVQFLNDYEYLIHTERQLFDMVHLIRMTVDALTSTGQLLELRALANGDRFFKVVRAFGCEASCRAAVFCLPRG